VAALAATAQLVVSGIDDGRLREHESLEVKLIVRHAQSSAVSATTVET